MAAHDLNALEAWIGKTESREDLISPAPAAGLSATLDYGTPRASVGDPLPPLWHWLYFHAVPRPSETDRDGHPRRGGFLPPVALPRRMWAGSRIRFESPLRVGDRARRDSAIASISHKQGSAGDLVFVTVRHRIYRGDALAIEEEQDLVYRETATGNATPAPQPAPEEAQWTREITPDPVLLFRYSAFTLNSHRIHYDRDYAMNVEGYQGLVVQGPLTATLLLDSLYREWPDAQVKSFSFRGMRPLLDGRQVLLQGRRDDTSATLWALDEGGALAMKANARLQ
ncbi:MAG: MaoC family dehydratase N-terminal domain-containing protein [Halioglobus sp.]